MRRLVTALAALLPAMGVAAAGPPEVTILTPGPDQAAVGPTTFEVAVDAEPGTGVVRVELMVDGHPVAVLEHPPWRAVFDAGSAFRPHTLRAVATDSAGREGSALGTTLYIGLVEEVTVVGRALPRVAVPVGVLDRKGRPVPALESSAFSVKVGGRAATVLAAGPDPRPLAVEILLDISGSLRPYWSQAREAVHRFLAGLDQDDGSECLVFAGSLHRIAPFGHDREAARSRIDALEQGLPPGFRPNGTRLYDSLAAAIEEINVRPGQRSMLVLTDTFDSGSRLPWQAVESVVRQAGLRLDVIRFGRPAAVRWSEEHRMVRRMRTLAKISGGRVWRVRSPEDIPDVFSHLVRELKSRYRLQLAPDDRLGPGLQRLRVSVPGHRGQVLAPAGLTVRLPEASPPPR